MGDYRKLRVWRQARKLTYQAYRVTAGFPPHERFGLTAQIRRAAVSIMANIAEDCGRNRDGELLRFLTIARGSATELDCHLIVAEDQSYLDKEAAPALQQRVELIQRMLMLLIHRLRNK